jgi:membrane protease YdiL (CAAX protease family)
MTVRERLADVGRFVLRPSFASEPLAWGRDTVAALALLLVVTLAGIPAVRLLVESVFGPLGVLPAAIPPQPINPREVLEYLLLAPLLEELLFRGWLTGRRAALRFAVFGFAALGLFLAAMVVSMTAGRILALAAVACVFAGLIRWSRSRHRDTAVPRWFIRDYRWIVWGTSVLFGLIHLGRFEPLPGVLGLVVVVPIMFGGMLLAYTRTRLGLGAAIIQHAVFNALVLAGGFALA